MKRFATRARWSLLLMAAACSTPTDSTGGPGTTPLDLGDGLGGAEAEARGMNADRLGGLIDHIAAGQAGAIHSVLIWRRGDLVVEEYFPGTMLWDGEYREFDRNTRHDVFSVSKSFTAGAVGLALRDGLIPSLDTPILDLLPEYQNTPNEDLSGLTVRHLLTMSAGLRWDELTIPYSHPDNDHAHMNDAADPLEYVLTRPLDSAPGSAFTYNSGLTHLLGEIVAVVAGRPMDEYVAERLFTPMGITDYWWYRYPGGVTHAGGGLHLQPRDMVKYGLLHLRDGDWFGARLLDSDWVEAATHKQAADRSYGFQWWVDEWPIHASPTAGFSAQGLAGQFIFVVPDQELIVVFTGNNNENGLMFAPFRLMGEYVLPAIEG